MLKFYLDLLLSKASLTQGEAESAMDAILEGAGPYQIAAFLFALKYRGETAEEVAGMVRSLEKKMIAAEIPYPVLDIVGTGGDLAGTVNISTGSALLAAACGIPIAKHGNRSVSSRSGSADVLEALGIEIEIPKERLNDCLQEANIAFMFAPFYHPSLKKLGPIRKGLKLPTIVNLLGPLLNPARAEYALIGVANSAALEVMARALLLLGNKKRALIFHGSGLDELTPLGPIIGYAIEGGEMERIEIDPVALGFFPCSLQDLQGGDAQENASLLLEAFSGKEGAIADALVFNAGAAVWIFGRAASLEEGIQIARKTLKAGKALEVLNKWRQFSEKKPGNYLEKIVVRKKKEVEELMHSAADPRHALNQILQGKHVCEGRFSTALRGQKLAVIGEIKRRSPSRKEMAEIKDPVSLALEYCRGGAAAISVLTDREGFGGTLEDLRQIADALAKQYPHIPVLRKDFIIHPLQLAEAALAGSSAVLLIARVLGKDLRMFIDEATRLGLETLTELHDLADLKLALEAKAPIIGINHRNLATFAIDLHLSEELRPHIPPGVIVVAESGIQNREQAGRMHALGCDAILVGEALVCSESPAKLIAEMRGENNES